MKLTKEFETGDNIKVLAKLSSDHKTIIVAINKEEETIYREIKINYGINPHYKLQQKNHSWTRLFTEVEQNKKYSRNFNSKYIILKSVPKIEIEGLLRAEPKALRKAHRTTDL